MIDFKFRQGKHCVFAASGTPADILADMGILVEHVAFALAQSGVPDSVISTNIARVAAAATANGIKKAKGKEAL